MRKLFVAAFCGLLLAGTHLRGETFGPYTYSVDSGEITITAFDQNYTGDLTILASIPTAPGGANDWPSAGVVGR